MPWLHGACQLSLTHLASIPNKSVTPVEVSTLQIGLLMLEIVSNGSSKKMQKSWQPCRAGFSMHQHHSSLGFVLEIDYNVTAKSCTQPDPKLYKAIAASKLRLL